MKNSKKIKELQLIQKIGVAFIIIGGVMTIGRMLSIIDAENEIIKGSRSYITLIGFALYLIPILFNRIKSRGSKTLALLVLLSISTISTISAQDYSKQIEAFKQSFIEKSIENVKPYLSAELKFDPIPAANTSAIMTNIVSQLPKLNSLTLLENQTGKAKVKYDFVGLGMSESYIFFNEADKITRIEFVENLIKQQMAEQQKMQESVQLPTFGEFEKKYMPTKVEFPSKDGLIVNGNLYEIDKNKPIILLCHQAGYNRIEYVDIAPRLNELGFNCLAIDQRSGGNFAGRPNNTNQRAIEKGLETNYIDAQQDIEAAIDFLYKKYNRKVIIWGSSYSSSLVLHESLKNEKVKASISFSPGDYFGNNIESLASVFKKIDKPFFVTSSKEEATTLSSLIGNTKLKNEQIQFIPKSKGFHGSRALWKKQVGGEEYWHALLEFLNIDSLKK